MDAFLKLLAASGHGTSDTSTPPPTTPTPSTSAMDPAALGELLRSLQGGSLTSEDETMDSTSDEAGGEVSAIDVYKMLSSFKDGSGFGDLIHDSKDFKIWHCVAGANHRYTINREIQVDANVFNEDVWLHIKRKFPKSSSPKDSVSVRAGLIPALNIILKDAIERLQPTLFGKTIDPTIMSLAQKFFFKK